MLGYDIRNQRYELLNQRTDDLAKELGVDRTVIQALVRKAATILNKEDFTMVVWGKPPFGGEIQAAAAILREISPGSCSP